MKCFRFTAELMMNVLALSKDEVSETQCLWHLSDTVFRMKNE